jgi:hypothetical protein
MGLAEGSFVNGEIKSNIQQVIDLNKMLFPSEVEK